MSLIRNLAAAIAASALMLSQLQATAGNALEHAEPTGNVVGLIVHYSPGTKPRLSNGLAEVSKYSSSPLFEGKPLGSGFHSVSFRKPTSVEFAAKIVEQIRRDPRVVSVSIDQSFVSSSALKAASLPRISSAVRVSPVQALQFVDSWDSNFPYSTAAKLGWQQPKNLAGAKLSGYLVWYKVGSSFKLLKTTSDSTIQLANLAAGKKYTFKVAAIVKKGSIRYQGSSRQISGLVTSAPRPPILNPSVIESGSVTISWQKQSLQQAGGLATSYRVTGSLSSEISLCETALNFCTIPQSSVASLDTLSVMATNSKGVTFNRPQLPVTDTFFSSQWYLNGRYGVNAVNAWPISEGDPAVKIAVIDSGITQHADLSGSLVLDSNGVPYGFDFVSKSSASADSDGWDSNPTDPGDFTPTSDSSWHGTGVTGIISAQHNQIGISGIAPNAQIVSVRALGIDGGRLSDVLAALNWSAGIRVPGTMINAHPAKIINASISSEIKATCDATAQAVIQNVFKKGAVVVASAGNKGINVSKSFPANCPGVISVAASTRDGELANYSNYGSTVTIAAPGGDDRQTFARGEEYGIVSTVNRGLTLATTDAYASIVGTSVAAPMVSAAVALMLSVNPKLTRVEIVTILRQTASKFSESSSCNVSSNCGAGILNIAAAVEMAQIKSL